ncbi:MAG: hypothetical protein OXF01_01805 [Gemmatimonadetes bacterium]|nr:hypothetical protein [Gemmatimonadota bacterium]
MIDNCKEMTTIPGNGPRFGTPRARWRADATAILVITCAAACSGPTEPNRAPERQGTIPGQTLQPGESSTFDIADFFNDPDGDRLTYTTESSHAGQATATISGSDLTISGIAEGDPSVTVTATDPGGLTAAQSTNVSVRLPNRAPEAVGSIPSVSVDEESPVELDVVWYFRDPDRDRLTYTAVSSDADVAAVEVAGSVVRFLAVSSGVTSVIVTAADPSGLSATQEVQLQSTAGPPGFRDDFDSDELNGWQIAEAGAQVSDGVLQLTNTTAGMPGRAVRTPGRRLTNWQADIRLGRGHEDAVVRAVFRNATTEIPTVAVEIGSGVPIEGRDTNLRFLIRPQGAPGWQPVFFADSDAIADSTGQFTEVSVALRELRISVAVGSDTLYFEDLGQQGAPAELGILTGMELWVVPLDGANERTALFDWIEVDGTPVAGSPGADGQSPASGDRARSGNSARQPAPAAAISLAPASAATPPRPAATPRIRSGRWPRPGSRD